MWLIVGLGNPGVRYELTRHNFGFLAIDALLEKLGISTTKEAFSGQMARSDIEGEPSIFIKPQTFMNRSGTCVQQTLSFHKISIDNLIVIHDELDLPLGEMRIKRGGGNGGHNGLKDISRFIGPDFIRVRLGIGRPNIKGTEADYVLHPFSEDELAQVNNILTHCVTCVFTIVTKGLETAQKQCQIKKPF